MDLALRVPLVRRPVPGPISLRMPSRGTVADHIPAGGWLAGWPPPVSPPSLVRHIFHSNPPCAPPYPWPPNPPSSRADLRSSFPMRHRAPPCLWPPARPGHRGLDPYAYLRDVLTRLPHMTNHQIHEVTPAAWAKQQKQKLSQAAA